MRQDLTYALRALFKNPGFSAVAILSLALAIGANTTIFTIVNAVLLRPLPFFESERLIVLNEVVVPASEAGKLLGVHPASYVEWQSRARSFEALVLVQAPPLNVMGASGAEQISRMQTTGDLYRVFGVRPVMGRGFTDDDTRPGADAGIVILGYGFWQRWFGGDPSVVGRRLAIQDGSLTIIGVAPAGFRIGTNEPDAFTPLTIDPAKPAATGSRAFESFGRLRPGVTLAAAQAEMTALAAAIQSADLPTPALPRQTKPRELSDAAAQRGSARLVVDARRSANTSSASAPLPRAPLPREGGLNISLSPVPGRGQGEGTAWRVSRHAIVMVSWCRVCTTRSYVRRGRRCGC
jgi:hypothetical protein